MVLKGPVGVRDPRRLVFVGLGGIGSWLVEPLIRYFNRDALSVVLVDGDHVETKNLARQSFSTNEVREYKTEGLRRRLTTLFPNAQIVARFFYVEESNVAEVIQEGDAVFVCPDNHRARNTISKEAVGKSNITVFTAGNELYDGSCHVYVKKDGVELTHDFMHRHPEAQDGPERAEGCDELIDMGEVQLITVNFMMASMVFMAVHQVYCYGNFRDKEKVWTALPQEVYGSVVDGRVRTTLAPDMPKKEKAKEVVTCSS